MKRHKGMFKKGGGRVGDGRKGKARRAMVRHKRRSHGGHRKRSRRRGGGGGGLNLGTLAITALAAGALTSSSSPVKFIAEQAAKLPGAKTFGVATTALIAAGAVDYAGLYRNKYLRYAGYLGVGMALLKLGSDNTGFKWLGDNEYAGDLDDVEGVEDVEDVEDLEDLEGDDD